MAYKLWLVLSVVVRGGCEIMAGRRRAWVVVEKLCVAVSGCGWLWMVTTKLWLAVYGRGCHFLFFVFIVKVKMVTAFLTLYVPREEELLSSKKNGYSELDW